MLSLPHPLRWLVSAVVLTVLFSSASHSGGRSLQRSVHDTPRDAAGVATGIEPDRMRVELVWESGAPQVDIWSEGAKTDTLANVGYYTAAFEAIDRGTWSFQVCNAGTTHCHQPISVAYTPFGGGPPADCPPGFANAGTVAANTLRACRLPALITGNLLVPNRDGTVYAITGRVDVGQDRGGDINAPVAGAQAGVLTIEPGVRLFGAQGLDYIVVNRGSQMFAEGTAASPIVFTSSQGIEGQTDIDSIGQWGGLVVLGRAPTNACPGQTVSGTPECQAQVEGTNAFYGGNFNADNSGRLRYVRVQFSGFEILPNNELNGITLAGVGNGTVFEYVQVHNSSDDGIEWFGGSVNGRYLVLTGNDDDSLDTDTGWNGALQFGIVVQRAGGGDRMAEFSSIDRTPASNPKVANFTLVGRASGSVGIIMNSGTNSQWYNLVVTKPATGTGDGLGCLDVDSSNTTGSFNSVFFACPQPFVDDANGQAAALFNAGTNNTAQGTSTLQNTFVNGANEAAVPGFAALAGVSPFFQPVGHIGGVRDANDNWWQGWTCGLPGRPPCHNIGGSPPTGLSANYAFALKQHRTRVLLRWMPGMAADVYVRFEGQVVASTSNDGAFAHTFTRQGSGTVRYQVCNLGTTQCSSEIVVPYRSRP